MIERWRNNERLLSPNEQPLVTLQRWGDRMNEVEFILRKTSVDPLPPPPQQTTTTSQPQLQQQVTNDMPLHHTNNLQQQEQNVTKNNASANPISFKQESDSEIQAKNHPISNGSNTHEGSLPNHANITAINQQVHQNKVIQKPLLDQLHDNIYHPQLIRRPQTSLGPLTSSSSGTNIASKHYSPQHHRVANVFRPSLSASALPNLPNNSNVMQPNHLTMVRSRYADDQSISPTFYNTSSSKNHFNGYPMQPNNSNQMHKNYPYEDLYGTINSRNTSQPPAVPAKPRLSANITHPQQAMNNAQLNYYQSGPSPVNMYRPRHPPGYMEYIEAMSNRNSLPTCLATNPNYIHLAMQRNIFPRSCDLQNNQFYNAHQQRNGSESSNPNGPYYLQNLSQMNFNSGNESNQQSTSVQNKLNQINPKLIDSGLVINRGSAVNVRLPPSSHFASQSQNSIEEHRLDTSLHSNSSSVSQMGLDMLKIIEEQKRLLLNQKDELQKLDHDREYLEAKQNTEQAELINRIEEEIVQLETLWLENQKQIKKLENQDFDRELELLKAEQVRMEREIEIQKGKLARFDDDIAQCKSKIEQLEEELKNADFESENSEKLSTVEEGQNCLERDSKATQLNNGVPHTSKLESNSNGSETVNSDNCLDVEEENSNGSDTSDDPNLGESSTSGAKLRSDVAYVDKRGLISGIRSLKIDKTRAQKGHICIIHMDKSPPPPQKNSSLLLVEQGQRQQPTMSQ